MTLVIVDYGIGNVLSIANMLRSASVEAVVSSDPAQIRGASRLIIAGVGAFDAGMDNLNLRGLVPLLRETVFDRQVPVLGICLGMQLLMRSSEEGSREGLGWIDGRSVRIRGDGSTPLKVPHMGWNEIQPARESPLLGGLRDNTRFYFAHSYAAECTNPDDVIANTVYGKAFPAIVSHGNVYGVQFHPEKSHRYGRKLLENFAEADLNGC
jgi:imidazole glycerol-phosphate synthase subunit HisH